MVSVRTVKKRSGQTVPYDTKKIYRAIQGANNDSGEMSKADVNHVVLCVDTLLKKTEALTVEGIQDTVEETLMDQGFKKTAREYIRYRHLHEMRRNATQKLMESYDDLLFADAKDVDLKRDNANINTDAPMGIMLKLGTEGAKVYSDNYAIPEEFVEADKQNILHIHDKDFGMITWNCLSGDTRIVFKNALGSVKEVPFSYFDPFFERFGSMVSVEHCGFSVLSKNGKYDKVKRLMRRKHSGDIRKFVLSNGISFLATDDHQVALANGDVKNAKDVAVGEEIPITQYPDWEETIKEINLIDAFGPEERGIVISNSDYIRKNVPNERKSYFYDLLRGKKDCESNEALYNKDFTLHEYFTVRGISDIDERKLQLKAKKSRESIDAILPLNNDLGKIVGFVLSKGYLSADGTYVVFANSDQKILDSFKESISRIFPALNVVHRRRGSNKSTSGCDTINVFGKIFNRLFRGILAKQNLSNDIEVPKWYLNTSKDFLAGFIGAEIDGDGTVDNGYRMIVATNAKAYAYSIFDLFLKFNISAKVSIAQEEGSQAVVNGIPTTRNYDVYAVSCSGEALDNLAGFLHGSSIKINRISDKKLARRKRHDGKIVAIDRIPYVGYVYDFETEGHYFSANGILTHNCLQQDLAKTLKNGFNTGHGFLREPNSIRAAAALACIAIQSSQNDMLGGQSISCWDGALAPYVDKSFRKAFRGNLEKVISVVGCYDFGDAGSIDALKKEIKSLPESYIPAYVESFEKRDAADGFDIDGLCRFVSEKLNGANFTAREVWQVWNLSCRDVEEETKQAMEAAIHNFNSLHSRAGSQTPFSSLNYGLDTTPEGRLVTRMTLEAIWEGLGHGETPIFPISIFLLKSGVNYNPGDPNYDLFKEACKVSAKRLFPKQNWGLSSCIAA